MSTVIDAAARFRPAKRTPTRSELFAERTGFDPLVNTRRGREFHITDEPTGDDLASLLEETIRVVPGAQAFVSLYWDDKSCTEMTVNYSVGMLDALGLDAPGDPVEVEVNGSWYLVSFSPLQDCEIEYWGIVP